MTATKAPALAADLVAGLKRLKLAKVRAIAPEVLQTAKTQRWTPEELLRTLVEAEIAARDAVQRPQPGCAPPGSRSPRPSTSSTSLSSVPQATFDYLASLEWIRAAENLCLVGPAGTGKSHLLVALGHAAVADGHAGPLLRRRRPRRDALPRPRRQHRRQDHRHPAARRPRHRRRARLRAARPHRHPTAVPVRRRRLRTPLASASPATGPSTPGAASCPNTPPPPRCSTGSCTTPSSSSPKARATACAKPRREEAAAPRAPERSKRPHPSPSTPRRGPQTGPQRPVLEPNPRWGLSMATSGDFTLAVDTVAGCTSRASALSSGLAPHLNQI